MVDDVTGCHELAPEGHALLWAAGLRCDPPDGLLPAHENSLLGLAARHRLLGRLAGRLRVERPDWASRRLMLAAWQAQRGIAHRFDRQMEAVSEIASAMKGRGCPLIIIKGYAAHAWLREESAIRLSNDLDIFHEDLPALYETCQRLGYRGPVSEGHEYAQMTRPDVCVELHRHLMVASYPVSAEPLGPACLESGNLYQEAGAAGVTELRYDSLLPCSAPGRTNGEVAVAVPSPAMCVLIACAHEFREFIGRPWRQSSIKLAALAEICGLLRSPEFDATEFAELVYGLEAQDSVAFMAHLFEAFSGQNPLPPVTPRSSWASQGRFPQILTPMGPWLVLDGPLDLLEPFDADAAPHRLGGYPLRLPAAGSSERLPAFADGTGQAVPRVLVQGHRGARFPFTVTVSRTESGIVFDFDIPDEGDRFAYVATVIAYHCATSPNRMCMLAADTCPEAGLVEPNTTRSPSGFTAKGHGATEANRTPSGWRLRVALAWSAFSPSFRAQPGRPILLRLVRWEPGHSEYVGARPIVCLPLSVTLS